MFSHVWLVVTPWAVAHLAPLSMEFSRQEYWNGLPCSPPGDLSNPGIQSILLCLLHWQVDSLPLSYLKSSPPPPRPPPRIQGPRDKTKSFGDILPSYGLKGGNVLKNTDIQCSIVFGIYFKDDLKSKYRTSVFWLEILLLWKYNQSILLKTCFSCMTFSVRIILYFCSSVPEI